MTWKKKLVLVFWQIIYSRAFYTFLLGDGILFFQLLCLSPFHFSLLSALHCIDLLVTVHFLSECSSEGINAQADNFIKTTCKPEQKNKHQNVKVCANAVVFHPDSMYLCCPE